ncbi:hypothetical protein I6A84_20255 [Frankia sp. CNm7]|uniref:Uncharacterized protein n=1 Tax=Frankia nepalensis TaxID=1836974 RepID=A0A937US49_9ACTN|nr:hypothetical protein [Frankia nepalensis]MBL7497760.1 hypothetical protein [Frankia nepalensis]MBL7512020.1 hypothetical protein [Frankia nepalensis]MBL7520358.1 hypothetical protein [Frankia nepalensis]MBL7632072.1 hypothetical protein [Frankia nepalensis]
MPTQRPEFQELYRRHVQLVVEGDRTAVLADMVNIPLIFEGVTVPRGEIDAFDIVDMRPEGDTWVGETVYDTPRGRIGLRSTWELRDGSWKAASLENFPVTS